MECRSCGRQNRHDARFCSGCGTALTLNCASCSRELAPDARFCDACGTPVGGSSAPAPPPPEDAAARKTVTVLFCDLVGSTALGERVDAESAREVMARYRRMAQATIEANGGVVAKFIGDGVMALWGADEVREDDAELAVRAGIALQEAFAAIENHVRDRYGASVGLRVGVNTGEVVIDAADDDIVGDALNTAARLEGAATPGRVLVGAPTQRATRHLIDYADGIEIEAKGKDEPVLAYEVVGGLNVEERLTPFVGRVDELGRLRRVLESSILDRRTQMVTVVGSPGVGKTRLAQELRSGVEGGVIAHELRCEPAGDSTFAPVADLLRSVAGLTDSQTDEQIRASILRVVSMLDDADRVADLLAGFVGAAPMRSTEEAFFGVRRLLEVLGGADPVVLVVDDIQWAQPLFLDLLEHLAEWVTGVPLLIVALARPEIREVRSSFAEEGRRIAAVVSLEGLDASTTQELAARLLDADDLPAGVLDRIPDSTEGNPLFVREVVRMLVDDGVLVRRDAGWELAIDLDAVEVPPTVTALLASRVDRLEPDERRVLELASVVGSEFPIGVLVDVQGTSRAALAPVLERMRRKELVEPTGAYLGDDPLFRFHHVLIREAAYRRLLKGTRAELHQAVGEWTESAAERFVGDFDVTVGTHFEQARSYRLALDLDDDETAAIANRASAAFSAAANRALDQEDLEAAGSLASRALSMLDDTDDGVPELLLLACEALLSVGRVADAQPLIDRLGSVATGDERLTAWHACFAAELVVLSDPGGVGAAERQAAAAAEMLGSLDDTRGVAKAHLVRAAALVRLGQVGACEAELDRALTAARSADDRRRVTSVLGAAPMAALWGPSPVPRAGGRCLDVIRLLRITTASPAVEATSVRCQGLLEALRGRFDTARSMLDQARETVVELGLGHAVSQVDLYRGIAELLADDPEAAEGHLREAYRGLGSLGIGADAGQAAAYLARSLLAQGRLDEAEDLVLESDALAGQNPQTAIIGRSVHAEVLAARGDFGEALLLADEAVTLAAAGDILFDHASAVAAQARVHALAGDTDSATEAAAEAAGLYEQKGATVEVGLAIAAPSYDGAAPQATKAPAGAGVPPEAWTNSSVWEIGQRWADALNSDDLDAALALAHPDFVVDDRRFILGAEADDLGVHHEFSLLADPAIGVEFDALDVRGDDLGLGKVTVSTRSDRSTWEWLAILRVDGAVMVEAVVFALEDLAEARAELGRMAAERGRTPAEVLADRAYALIADGDFDASMALTAPEIRFVDRRAVVGAESAVVGFREMSRNIANPRMGLNVEVVDRLGDDVVAYRGQMATAGGTAAWEWVAIWHVVNGIAVEVVLVEPEDHEGIQREMERLAASSSARPSAAVEVMERVFAAIERNDAEAAIGLWHPDAVLDDRRFVAGSESADEGAEAQLRRMSHPSTSYRAELLDARGDELCLYRVDLAIRSGRAEWAMVAVYRVVAGQVVRAVGFDADQEAEARAELDRLAASPTTQLGNTASVVVDRMLAAAEQGDVEIAVEFWHPDGVFEDRQFVLGTESVEVGMIERTRLIVADESVSLRGELLDHRSDDLCLYRIVTTARSGRAEWEYLAIDRVVAGKIVHAILLDSSAEAEAHAELDRLAALSPAAAVVDRSYRALTIGDVEAAVACTHPDIRYEDRRFMLGEESEGAGLRSYGERAADPAVSIDAELVDALGDHVVVYRAMMAAPSRGAEWTWLAVWRVEDGLAVDLVLFDIDDLDSALAEAHRLAAGTDDAGWELLRACNRALVDGDVEGAVATMHPEIRWADRRLLGSLSDGVGPAELLRPAAHTSLSHGHELIDSRNGAYLFRCRLERDDGNEWVWLAVARVEDELITDLIFHEIDDLDAARATMDVLAGPATNPGPSNAASRIGLACIEAMDRGSLEECLAFLSEDAMVTDRRRLGLDEFAILPPRDAMASIIGQTTRFRCEDVIAVRGDTLALLDQRAVAADGSEWAWLALLRIDTAGTCDLAMWFDPEQLADAIDTLESLYLEGLDGFEATLHEQFARIGSGMTDRERPDSVMRYAGADFELADRRAMGLTLTRDEFLDFYVMLTSQADRVTQVSRQIHYHSLFSHVVTIRVFLETDGGASVLDFVVAVLTGPTGVFTRIEQYDPDDVAAAVASARAHDAEIDFLGFETSAVVRSIEVNGVYLPVLPALAGDATDRLRAADRAELIVDPERLEREPHAFGRVDRAVLAVRGEHLVLVQIGGHDEPRRWQVEQYDDDLRLVDWKLYENGQLAEAWDDLRARAEASGVDRNSGFSVTQRQGGEGAIADRLAPSFILRDHRPLGMGKLDREGFAAAAAGMATADNGLMITPAILADTGGVTLARQAIVWPGSVESDSHRLVVYATADDRGQLTSADIYELHDVSAARARFDELCGAESGSAPSNRVADVVDQIFTHLSRGALDAALEFVADDYAMADNRLIPAYDTDVSSVADSFAFIADLAPFEFELQLVAARGDRHALMRIDFVGERGYTFAVLAVDELDHAGRVRHTVSFEVEQIDEATEELNRLWRAGWSPVETIQKCVEAINANDYDAYLAMFHPDLRIDDRRFIGGSEVSDSGWYEVAKEMFHPSITSRFEVIELDGDVVLYTFGLAASGGNDWQWIAVNHIVDGRFVDIVMVDNDLDEARVAFDRMRGTAGSDNSDAPKERVVFESQWARLSRISDEQGDRFVIQTLDEAGEVVHKEDVGEDVGRAAEVDREWVRQSLADDAQGRGYAVGFDFIEALEHRDFERLELLLADDFVLRDSRTLGLGLLERTAYLESVTAMLEMGKQTTFGDRVDVSDDGSVVHGTLLYLARSGDDWVEFARRHVSVNRNGQLVSTDVFNIDDVDGANRRFEELVAGSSGERVIYDSRWVQVSRLTDDEGDRFILRTLDYDGAVVRERDVGQQLGRAAEVSRGWMRQSLADDAQGRASRVAVDYFEALEHRDRERVASLLADDFVLRDARTLGLGTLERAAYLETVVAMLDVDEQVSFGDVVKVSADGTVVHGLQLILVRSGPDWVEVARRYVSVIRDGQIAASDIFDYDDVDGASRRFAELAAGSSGERELGEDLDDEFVERVIFESQWVRLSRVTHDHTHRFIVRTLDGGGAVVHEEDVEQDLARAAELNRSWIRNSLTNDGQGRALRLSMDFAEAYAHRDIERMGSLLADDFVVHDGRSLGFGTVGRETYLESIAAVRDQGEQFAFGDPIEVSADGTVVHATLLVLVRSDDDWDEFIRRTVMVIRDGQLVWGETFDADDLEGAHARFQELAGGGVGAETIGRLHGVTLSRRGGEWDVTGLDGTVERFGDLDLADAAERYFELAMAEGEPPYDPTRWMAFIAAQNRRDLAGIEAALDPAFQMTDARELGFPDVDLAGYLDLVRVVADVPAVIVFTDELAADAHVAVHRTLQLTRAGDDWVETSGIVVGRNDMTGYHVFADGAVSDALTMARQISMEAVPSNRVTEAWRLLGEAFAAGDVTVAAEHIRPDMTFEIRRRGVGGVEGTGGGVDVLLESASSFVEIGMVGRSEPLVVLGDRHAVCRQTFATKDDSEEIVLMLVFAADDDGRVESIVGFDDVDLRLAFAEVIDRYLASGVELDAHHRLFLEDTALYNRLGADHEFEWYSPDFRVVDHRASTVFAEPDRAQYIELQRDMAREHPDLAAWLTIEDRTSSALLMRMSRWLSGADATPSWDIFLVARTVDGVRTRYDAFDLDQEDDARRLLAELRADDPD